jgi:hypothetical protein
LQLKINKNKLKMKKSLLTLVAVICIATFTVAQTQPQIQQNDTSICLGESIGINLIGILPDSSNCIGNMGAPNPSSFPSASGGGYIPLGTLGAQSVFSISMWINPATVQNSTAIIIDASHGGSANWVIQTLNSGSTWTWGSGVFTLIPNTWQHLLLTYNSGNRKVFINGNEVQSWFQTISYSGSPALYLGNWPEGGRRFSGLIDELYITTDILYTNNFIPEEIILNQSANTFGLWHFDEGTGMSTNNSSNVSYPLNSWFWGSRNIVAGGQYSILWSTGDTTENVFLVAPNIDSQYTVTISDGATIFYDTININVLGNSLSISQFLNQLQTGSLASFTASTSDSNSSFIWQSNLGQGFQTLNNFGQYSGTSTNTMSISNVQLSNHMVPIRAISTSGNCKDTSNIAYIKITDTCITKVTKYDTITTKITKYDTIKVMDTLVINANLSGISAPNNTNRIIVYPNPAKDHITIDYGVFSRMSGYTVKITNTLGQTVFTSPINQQTSYINLSTWTGKGLYYLQIIDPNSNMIENRKIVLQ